jgi:hypothetical protein
VNGTPQFVPQGSQVDVVRDPGRHFSKGMSRGDMKELGETLDAGKAALIVVGSLGSGRSSRKRSRGYEKTVEKELDADSKDFAHDLEEAQRELAKQDATPARQIHAAGADARGGRDGWSSGRPSVGSPCRRSRCAESADAGAGGCGDGRSQPSVRIPVRKDCSEHRIIGEARS